MFTLRLGAVALSVLLIGYCLLSLVVSAGWKLIAKWGQSTSAARSARVLFAWRMLPLVLSLLVTALYAVPSFLIFEPGHIDEKLGPMLIVLSVAACAWLSMACMRAFEAHQNTAQMLSDWRNGSTQIKADCGLPVVVTSSSDPVLTVTGVSQPSVFISEKALASLTVREFEAAVRHEAAHVQRYDNLKKLLLRFGAFPCMKKLEAAWIASSEIAADDAAISNSAEALDLASALIKCSRFATSRTSGALGSALIPVNDHSVATRITRLCDWSNQGRSQNRDYYGLPLAVTALLCVALTYAPLLRTVHALTEWLVR
jgi:Zn-dependent protease with chaperone function